MPSLWPTENDGNVTKYAVLSYQKAVIEKKNN